MIPLPDDSNKKPPAIDLPVNANSLKAADVHTVDREQLILGHLYLVRAIARRIHERLPQHVSVEDLYSSGVVGLLDAAGKFDFEKKIQFRTYAKFRIRGAILDGLRSLDWAPRNLRRKARAIEQAIRTLTISLQRVPSDLEIALHLHLDLASYQVCLGELKGLEIGTLHLDCSDECVEEELACRPTLPKDNPLSRYLHSETLERLVNAISNLSERERLVITLYYYEETTMKEIGVVLGVQESRVSQIHASAVLRLRAGLAGSSARQTSSAGAGRSKGSPIAPGCSESGACTMGKADTRQRMTFSVRGI